MKNLIVALTCLSATGLAAQTRVNGGIHTGLMLPTGDFNDKRGPGGDYLGAKDGLGLHFGGHLDLNFTPQNQLRLHLTLNGFSSKEQDFFSDNRQNTFSIAQLGGDYVHNFTNPSRGGYFLAGASLNQVKARATFATSPDAEVTQSGRPGIRVGGGFNFNRAFSLEGSFNSISVDKDGPDGLGFDAITWVGVSAVFRFGR